MTNEHDQKMSYSPFAEDRKQTIAQKVLGNGLKLAPVDVADQTAAKKSGALDRLVPAPDPRDDQTVSASPADQRDELLAEMRRQQERSSEQ